MVQTTLLDPGGHGATALPHLHSTKTDALVSADASGGHGSSRSESLRHSIVEMAGKATHRDQETRQMGSTRIYHLGHLDSSRHIRQHLSDIEASCGNKPRIALITKRHDRIDLDVTKAQRQNGHVGIQTNGHHYQSPATFQPQPPTGPGPKDRASAWLLKRFRKRHEKSAVQQPTASSGVKNDSLIVEDKITEPRKAPPIAPGSGKRVSDIKDNGHLLSTTVKKTEPSFRAHTSVPRQTRQTEGSDDGNICALEYYGESEKAVDRQNSVANELKAIYGVRGTAIPPPPAKERHVTRPTGLFSASLEAFKRRMKITSSKQSQRLHGDEMEGTDSYLITAEKPVVHQESARPKTSMPTINNTGRQHSAHPGMRHKQTRPSTPPFGMFTDAPLSYNIQNHFTEPHPPKEPRPLSKTRLNLKDNGDGENPEEVNCESSPSKPQNSPEESPRFTYKLPDAKIDENKEVTFGESSKLHIPSVKTYVLQSSQHPTTKDKTPQPAPLTMHNLKLHESLHAIYDRRRKRLERHQRNVQTSSRFNLSNSSSNGSGDSGPSERMWQWLKEATEQSTLPPSEVLDDSSGDVLSFVSDEDRPGLSLPKDHADMEPIYV